MSEEEIMSEEAFKELIDNLEIIEKLTPYGRKAIKYWVTKLQKENEEKNKQIDFLSSKLSDVCTGIPQIIEQVIKNIVNL